MEPASLVTGVIALASLFNTTVECFELVQLGRSFGKDFQTSQLKLDSVRLRLSRWGSSLGLGENIRESVSLEAHFESRAEVKHAEDLLGQIIELFADAEGVSNKYRGRVASDNDSLAVYNPQTDLDPVMADLHSKMRQLAIDRQNRSGLRQKAKWAIYQEKHFRRLIEDITELVNSLVTLFPASEKSQRTLCDLEVSAIVNTDTTPVLKEVIMDQDKLLLEALNQVSTMAETSYHIVFSGNNNSGVQIGYNSGPIGLTFGRGN